MPDNTFPLEGFQNVESPKQTMFGTPMVEPLSMRINTALNTSAANFGKEGLTGPPYSDFWLLPTEPLISLSCENIIVRRSPMKANNNRGTIKEVWAQNDYEVTISGFFQGPDMYTYPEKDLLKLRHCVEAGLVDVLCPMMERFSIHRLIIENLDLPFTKGENVQNWVLQCKSDSNFLLLEELKPNENAALRNL